MGRQEILWRIRQLAYARLESIGFARARPSVIKTHDYGRSWLAESRHGFVADHYVGTAEQILAGRFDVFALHDTTLGFPPRWNRDPKTGTEAPLTFGKTLNYRDERVVGDIKYLWEPNRHLELVTLAQAWHLTGEMKYAEGCRMLLDSWFEQCPYPLGPNWTSSLEHAVRLLNWSVAWQMLGEADSPLFAEVDGEAFRQRWLDSIYQHCYFIAGYFSRHSSANNHLFGEYMGLFIGALMWPCWRESANWLKTAQAGLEEEALKQNAPDGVNREQAVWYQHEVADMMLLCGLAGRANGIEFSAAWWNRLEAMLEFIASLMDVAGKVPMVGDSDDAVMVRFSCKPGFNVYQSLLATGSVLFERGDLARKAGTFDDKSRWLLGEKGAKDFARLVAQPSAMPASADILKRAFREGGYYILGDQFDTPDEVRIVADAGQLGYLSIAAHGHADALAFTLSAGGHEILIDPGTFAYHTRKKWRDYFRGTSAHNTVRVDGLDQSVIGGNFMWLKHAKARCEEWESDATRDLFVGSHDGYERLSDPVTHRRSIEYDKRARVIRVTDTLTCKATHHVEIFWHLPETCQIQAMSNEISARCGNRGAVISMPDSNWMPAILSGEEDPPMGWVSRHFDQKCPGPSIVWSGQISGNTTLNTEIRLMRHES